MGRMLLLDFCGHQKITLFFGDLSMPSHYCPGNRAVGYYEELAYTEPGMRYTKIAGFGLVLGLAVVAADIKSLGRVVSGGDGNRYYDHPGRHSCWTCGAQWANPASRGGARARRRGAPSPRPADRAGRPRRSDKMTAAPFAAMRDAAKGAVGGVIVECDGAIVEAAHQRSPARPGHSGSVASSDLRESWRRQHLVAPGCSTPRQSALTGADAAVVAGRAVIR